MLVTKELDKNQYRCVMQHPAVKQKSETDFTLNVHYPPHSIQMSGNRTEKTITCSSIANPPPTYYYQIGRTGKPIKIGNGSDTYCDRNTNFLDFSELSLK